MATQSTKPIVLYSFPTPNGVSASILLEELQAAYNGAPEYEAVALSIKDSDLGKVHNHVKSPWFLEINPNGRIPAITHEGFNVFETSAILVYLAQQFDKEHKFSHDPVTHPKEYSEELQWIFFTHGGLGPMFGQAGHFARAAPEKIPYAIDRYVNETKRLLSVLETRLTNRDYLAGSGRGSFGIADIKTYPWARRAPAMDISFDELPNLKAWVERIDARPAVQAGLKVPTV